jgi:hypothetical protein
MFSKIEASKTISRHLSSLDFPKGKKTVESINSSHFPRLKAAR